MKYSPSKREIRDGLKIRNDTEYSGENEKIANATKAILTQELNSRKAEINSMIAHEEAEAKEAKMFVYNLIF